jgi:arylsulfatase A-like enzyme
MRKPNIIYICTDQQSASMMSCAGNGHLNTPAMDYLAKNGTRYTRAYTTNPVCSPSRVSMMTGRFPSEFNDKDGNAAKENLGSMSISTMNEEQSMTTLGFFMKESGYEMLFGGKEHLPNCLIPVNQYFKKFTDNERGKLASKTADYIRNKHGNPYFMVVSLINPHDICYMAIRDFAESGIHKRLLDHASIELDTLDEVMAYPGNFSEKEFYDTLCPPLPQNYEIQEGEPKAIQYLVNSRPFKKEAREKYTPEQWRMHRWAYARLTEKVDHEISQILDALKESGEEENTLVIFSSDHGDHDSAHHLEHKTSFYEEAANVPFIAMWKGNIAKGEVDDFHLISNGLDLLPTICDYAGVKGNSDPRGRSLRPIFEKNAKEWRKTLGVESELGKMVVGEDKLKYIVYDVCGREEILHDLNCDSGELSHFTSEIPYRKRLEELRESLDKEWFPGCPHYIGNSEK